MRRLAEGQSQGAESLTNEREGEVSALDVASIELVDSGEVVIELQIEHYSVEVPVARELAAQLQEHRKVF